MPTSRERTIHHNDINLSQRELMDALFYLAATQMMDKEIQNLPWDKQKPYFERITVIEIHNKLGDFTNPSQKLTHLIDTGGVDTVRMMAERWRETHPKEKTQGELPEIK